MNLPNSLALQSGETKQLAWRFGHAGNLVYACHEPGHSQRPSTPRWVKAIGVVLVAAVALALVVTLRKSRTG